MKKRCEGRKKTGNGKKRREIGLKSEWEWIKGKVKIEENLKNTLEVRKKE